MLLVGLLLAVTQGCLVASQTCPVDIPDAERRDCYPWVNATQELCEQRGCVWCAAQQEGFPWCFYNFKVCPSSVPEGSRVDCMPEGGDRYDCLKKDCLWCETATGGVPWCFNDPSNSLGGAVCPVDIPVSERIDCHPDPDADELTCVNRGCYWCPNATDPDAPECFAPLEVGYRMMGEPVSTPLGWRVSLQRVNTPSWFGQDIDTVTLDVEYQTDTRLRLKFFEPAETRFEVPMTMTPPGGRPSNPLYNVTFESDPVFSVKVIRISTGVTIFDTSIGGFQFADQFLQLSSRLDSDKIYGFGEQEHPSFKHDMSWETWPMWTRDQWVTSSNLYGTQPFYVNVEQSNNAHGVLFLNANAQEVKLLPAPALTYRTIGGVLDVFVFMGPGPEDVVQQYTTAVGFPLMPPYWALGFQLCRFGYSDLDHMKEAVGRMRQYNIPHDVQYGDIDYMDGRKDFTIDPVNFAGLEEYVDELKTQGTRFVILIDPAIYNEETPGVYPPLDNGLAYDVFIKDPTGQFPQEGEVWPGKTLFPDYFKPETEEWWTAECVTFKERLNYDGLWIDMNEPANFVDGSEVGCNDNRWNSPPYVPGVADSLWKFTLCLDTITNISISYNAHSLYGWSMARQTLPAARAVFPGQRSIVFSRSTFPGAGQWGQHWLGDNYSRWSNLRSSVIGMMEFNIFGIPYVGADICGYNEPTTEEMCRRWQQLGAFYPFSRNHNGFGFPDQDPGIWETVANDTLKALTVRYRLLPYLYTLFHKAHTQGGTVVRPLLFEFVEDSSTHDVQDQFLWGPALMISPVLDQGVTSVSAYFPDQRWFDYFSGAEESTRGSFVVLDTPLGDINLHLRGGFIIPVQQPANSTVFSQNNPMGLLISLSDSGTANGDLFWDDGLSVDTFEQGQYFLAQYQVENNTLTNTIERNGFPGVTTLVMDDFIIHGADVITSVFINGQSHEDWTQDVDSGRITISNGGLELNSTFILSWS